MSDSMPMAIDDGKIESALRQARHHDRGQVEEILARARELKGLTAEDVAVLARVSDPELLGEVFKAAREVKEAIYGSRLVIFAPLYVSNLCGNDCLYCAFRSTNRSLHRKALSQEVIANETEALLAQGHKRVLLVAGESYPREGFRYVLDSIETIYSTRHAAPGGEAAINRINVNVAPLSVDEFRQLRAAGIGTYQLFQETYHRETYLRVHRSGPKRDYDWRVGAMDRAMESGIDDVGIGVLFGLANWRYELLALMQHAKALEERHGVGPHTISVPRLEPALDSSLAANPPHPVSDIDFRKIVAILRLAVPYTGIIMSTRETPNIRRETFALGVSQISAGSRTSPGSYESCGNGDDAQFQLGDHRSLDEVIRDVASLGYVPSFCTACYRLGRTGTDFMDLARPGEIKNHCEPNALSSFEEYLQVYATKETQRVGRELIEKRLAELEENPRRISRTLVCRVRDGGRDIFV